MKGHVRYESRTVEGVAVRFEVWQESYACGHRAELAAPWRGDHHARAMRELDHLRACQQRRAPPPRRHPHQTTL